METKYYIVIGLLLITVVLTFFVPLWLESREHKKWMKRNGK
jgi:hypothetical protein